MFLARVTVQNFRNLRAFEVAFRSGLNVILGENNVGKTNLLDAIRLALSNNLVGESVRLAVDDLSRPPGNPRVWTIGVDLWFEDLSQAEQAEFLELLNYNPPNVNASLHYRATWNPQTERWSTRRWGGNRPDAEAGVPDEVFQSIPVTILGALRDSLTSLQPGRQSRLARLLKALATNDNKGTLRQILNATNLQLEADPFITEVQKRIRATYEDAAGPAFTQSALIRASEPDFEKIAQNLRLVLDTNAARPAGEPVPPVDIE